MSAVRSFRHLVTALMVCVSARPLEAQSRVTATSGDPFVIGRIRSEFETIERNLSRYRKVDRDIDNVSTDGGHATAYYEGDDLRKLEVGIFGESGSSSDAFYFMRGAPFFIFHGRYGTHLRGEPRAPVEDRLYIDSGVVIRHLQTGVQREPDDPGTFPSDPSAYTNWLSFYLRCIGANGEDPPECSAPDSLSKDSYKPTVGATDVTRHRELYEDIEHRLRTLRHASADMHTVKLEGTTSDNGVLDAYCDGDSIRLFVANFTIPDASATIRMYFVHDSLFFVYRHGTRRDRAKSNRTRTAESRWYFIDNQVVRWLENDIELAITTDDHQAAFWLARARDLSEAMPACTPRLR